MNTQIINIKKTYFHFSAPIKKSCVYSVYMRIHYVL